MNPRTPRRSSPPPVAALPPSGPVPIPPASVGRMTLRLDDLSATLGVSRRAIERERSAGRFPPPDLTIGRMPLWRVETIRQWVEGGGPR